MQITIPTLNEGELYAGLVITDGKPTHHVVLLPGELEKTTWEKAKAWAAEQGGELPTRREQALLLANAPEAFQRDWYWSGEQHAVESGYAWYQGFTNGDQNYDDIYDELRARAVRRVAI